VSRNVRRHLLALLALALLAQGARGQESDALTRGDGASVPVRVYGTGGAACRGVAILSPGAGGTEKGLSYLAEALGRDGWLSVVAGHRESGPSALRADLRGRELKDALLRLTTDRSAYEARSMDLGTALDWARSRCASHYGVLVGHSMGAATVMLEAGADNKLGLSGTDRFDAYVAMSPQGPGSLFPEGAWRRIAKPMLMLTGTRDGALEGDWSTRTVPYDEMPAGCKWLGVIDGAKHMDFGGRGRSRDVESLTVRAAEAFLDSAASGGCGPLPEADGIAYRRK